MTGVLACCVLLAGQESGEAKKDPEGWTILPAWHIFEPLLADPRWPHFSASYQRWSRDPDLSHVAAVSFGERFGLLGYEHPEIGKFELGIQAGVFALFDLDSDSYDLINADYWVGFPLTWRAGPVSAMLRVFHQSSHLGDEFILRASVERINLSVDEVDLLVSLDVLDFRIYAGGGSLLASDPEGLERGVLQAGVEYQGGSADEPEASVWPVVAVDVQRKQRTDGTVDVSVRAGLSLGRWWNGRRVMLLVEYYRGSDPNGQFFEDRIETIGLGLHLNF